VNDNDLLELIKVLDKQIAKDGAIAKFRSYGEVALYANKIGYLRLGIELFKCALKETQQEADLRYMFLKDSDFGIDQLTFTEEELDFYSN
jgi:hypothetical protein